MRKCVRLTALTPEERLFAEENYSAAEWAIRVHRLDQDMHDIAYLGYLHAVKKWFADPGLRQWAFRTVVSQTVRSHVSGERRKQERQIQAVSLDAAAHGTDGLAYGHAVTYGNLEYLTGKEGKDMALKISYDIAIPAVARLGRTPSVEVEKLAEFLGSGSKTMGLEYASSKEAASKCSTLRGWKKRHQRTDFEIYKMAETIYIEKVKQGRKTRRDGNANGD